MRILFLHQNLPGQFGRLATSLAADARNEVAVVTGRADRDLPRVQRVSYDLRLPPLPSQPPIGAALQRQALYGKAAVGACRALMARGFVPDVVVGHPGWGELLFIKDLLPRTPLLAYCEFYHDPSAPYVEGDPPRPLTAAARARRRCESAHLLLSLEAADRGWSPTRWQRSVHPVAYKDRIEVIFDGVDADRLAPDPTATFQLADGRELRPGDEVLTYAARALEPMRGFPTFYRALTPLLESRPGLQVLIAGEEEPHYDAPPRGFATWAERMRTEHQLDEARVRFVGRLDRARFTRMLQVSRLHVYLTAPTVLSWSMVEAMSVGCPLLASDTPPVTEWIREGDTGHLVGFDDPAALADRADQLLDAGALAATRRARELVLAQLSMRTCLPAQRALVEGLAKGA